MENYIIFKDGFRGSDTLDGVKKHLKDKGFESFDEVVDIVLSAIHVGGNQRHVEAMRQLTDAKLSVVEAANKLCVELVNALYYGLIIPGKREERPRGYIDFAHDSGSMFRLEMMDRNGTLGILRFELAELNSNGETASSPFVQCLKTSPGCNGAIQTMLEGLFPSEWYKEDLAFTFTYGRFLHFYRALIRRMR